MPHTHKHTYTHTELLPCRLALPEELCELVDLRPGRGTALGELRLLERVQLPGEAPLLRLFGKTGRDTTNRQVDFGGRSF